MASRPIIWVMTSPCMLIYIGMIQGALRIWIYIYRGAPRRFIKEVFCSLWNKLPPWVKESTSLSDFKHNYRLWNGLMHSEFIVHLICTIISYPILMLSFYQFCLQLDWYNHIRNLSQCDHDIDAFMYDLYLWMCIYVFIIFMFFTL